MGAVVEEQSPLDAGLLEGSALVGVPDRDRQCLFGRRECRPGHADPALDKGAEHGEEATVRAVDAAGVLPVGGDVGEPVQQVLAWYPDMIELEPAVVDPEQPGLVTTVGDGHPGLGCTVVVTDR